MAANLSGESYEVGIEGGFRQHNYVRTYKVTTGTNLVTTTQDPGLPTLGSQIIIEGSIYWAMRYRARRLNDEAGRILSFVDVVYDNDAGRFGRDQNGGPASDPTQIAPYVQVQFAEYVDEVNDAILVRIENQFGNSMPVPPYLVDAQTNPGPVRNSAGKVIADVQQRKHHKIITYWTYHRDWTASWEGYVDQINSVAFTMTQRDSAGIRLQYSLAAKEARLADLIKEDHWMGDKLYFRRGLVIETKTTETWERQFPDKGHEMAIFKGQYNPFKLQFPNPLYTDAEINAALGTGASADPTIAGWITLVDVDKQPMTEPTPFNGWGAPACTTRAGANPSLQNRYKLVYTVDALSAWPTALGVT